MPSDRAWLLSLAAAACVCACATPGPPLPVGLVDMSAASPGQTALVAQGGAGGTLDGNNSVYGGALIAVEPRATPRLSVPLGVGAGGTAGVEHATVSTRAGLRYRFMDKLSLGGGFDSSHSLSANSLGELYGAGFDLELGGGGRFGPDRRLMFSGAVRPTVLFGPGAFGTPGYTFFALGDLSIGYAVIERLWLSAQLGGGSATTGNYQRGSRADTVGYLTGSVGLTYVFGPLRD